jgi:hypothetical protein
MTLRYLSVAVCLLLVMGNVRGGEVHADAKDAGEISLSEAEILIYALPEAHDVRAEGMEIGWELQADSRQESKHFYYFFVYNTKRQGAASVTVGHFAVNRHTAEVWDTVLVKRVESPELGGIQRIVRRARGIARQAMKQFSGLEP